MTALKEFERLESTALWRESDEGPEREVILSLGEATLTIADGTGAALGHWSLPAIERINPGQMPARFRPGPNASESLEITDDLMIGALERVHSALERRKPRPGRLRLWAGLVVLCVFAALLIFWLPGAMISHTASLVPPAERSQIGARIVAAISQRGPAPCNSPLGRAALDRLHARLLPDLPGRIEVLPGLASSAHLPGGIILLPAALLSDERGPAAMASGIVAEGQTMRARDPLDELLQQAGLVAALRLLVSGELSGDVIRAQAERILSRKTAPARPASAEPELPGDDDWLALRQICAP